MIEYFSKKYQKSKLNFHNFRSKIIVRVWNLAKRLDSKQIRQKRNNKKKG